MKNLVLTTLICGGLAQLGGCIIVSDDDGGNPPPPPDAMPPPPPDAPPPEPGVFFVSWTLLGGDAQESVQCPPDTDIIITADRDPEVDGDEEIYLYDCVAGEGAADTLDVGVYDLSLELVDADGILVAQSDILEAQTLSLGVDVEIAFTFSVDHGRFALKWLITENGVETTCDDIGADDVELALTVAGTTFAEEFPFPCADGFGVTDPLPIEFDYVGSVSLLDTAVDPPDPLATAPAENLSLDYGNHFKELPEIEFNAPPAR